MATITCKIVMCGDFAVGKTTFVQSFLGGEVMEGYKPTIGVDIGRAVRNIETHKIIFQIWDLSGQQSFSTIRKQFYSRSNGGVMVYDVSRRETYNNILQWTEEMLEQTGKIPIVLVANKIDLRKQSDDPVTIEEGEILSETISRQTGVNSPFVEASALNLINNQEPFIVLGKLIISQLEV
ncbi:MAG: GTP-binding protein [Candidatus Hodarchaeota archaeon]